MSKKSLPLSIGLADIGTEFLILKKFPSDVVHCAPDKLVEDCWLDENPLIGFG